MTVEAVRALELFEGTLRQTRPGTLDEELRALLASASVSTWLAFDRLARRVHVDDEDVTYRLRPSHPSWIGLSMTRSGYTRELALREIGRGRDVLSLAAVLLRSDDVVWTVRRTASESLAANVGAIDPIVAVSVLPLIDALALRQRAGAGSSLQALRERARHADVDVDALPLEVQRALLRVRGLAHDIGDEERVRTALSALQAGDIELALFIARRANPAVRAQLAPVLADERSARARTAAAHFLRHAPHERPRLLRLSVDVRAEVRGAARRALAEEDVEEQRDYARVVVDEAGAEGSARSLIGGLASLAEIGRPQDVGRISRFLHDERARVQAEAVRALAGALVSGDLAGYVDVLIDKLRSPSSRVAVEAARGLQWVPAMSLPVSVLQDLTPTLPLDARKIVARLVEPGRWSV